MPEQNDKTGVSPESKKTPPSSIKDNRFSTKDKFKDPISTFKFNLSGIDSIKTNCLIVLDTNVLFIPFSTDTRSFAEIQKLYKSLSDKDRLFVPSHVIKEFLDNRAGKIGDISHHLHNKMSQSFKEIDSYPLLNELESFKDISQYELMVKKSLKDYQKKIKETLDIVHSWTLNDPVTLAYQEVLADRILSDTNLDFKAISDDLDRRNQYNIPPGYRDRNKSDNTAGDLIIWNEILQLGQDKNKDIIFVSGDEKQDWWHQSGGKPIYPRIELIEEYRERSHGKSFHIVTLSQLMSMFDASPEAIAAIKSSEVAESEKSKTLGLKYFSISRDKFFNSPFYAKLKEADPLLDPEYAYAEFRKSEEVAHYFGRIDNGSVNWYDEMVGSDYEIWLELFNELKGGAFKPDVLGVKELVDNLNSDLRSVIDLVYYNGYTHEEAAKKLNLPISTIKTRIRLAIIELRKSFK